jgi:RNA polymerase sigma factor (sigma-70 family)
MGLWALHCRWLRPGADEAARILALFEDHRHWLLFVRSRAGEDQAGREFERHWRGYIRAFSGRRFPPEQVEEITSLFFARVYRLVGSAFDWHCPFTVYLRAILINVTRDENARASLRRSRLVSLEDETDAPARPMLAAGPSPEESTLLAERGAAVRRAMAVLKPVDRHIVQACLVEGVSGQDLARDLGMSRAALYQRLHRARARLREALEREQSLSDTAREGV